MTILDIVGYSLLQAQQQIELELRGLVRLYAITELALGRCSELTGESLLLGRFCMTKGLLMIRS